MRDREQHYEKIGLSIVDPIEEAKRQRAIAYSKKLIQKIEDSIQKMNLEEIKATNYTLCNIQNIANLVRGLKNTNF